MSLRNNRKVGDLSDTTISSRLEWVSHFMVGFLTDEIHSMYAVQKMKGFELLQNPDLSIMLSVCYHLNAILVFAFHSPLKLKFPIT